MRTKIITLTVALLVPARASAFQVETTVTHGCHEKITLDALAAAAWPDGRLAPGSSELDERVISDLPFSIPGWARDPWTTALLVGVRNNDVREHAPTQVARLVHIHNDPHDQPAHCIRMQEHDGAAGDRAALAMCKAYILGEIESALGDGDQIDLDAEELVDVFLAFRGEMSLPMSRYAFHTGRALHALQDSYTHSLRAPSDGRVRHVLNWIDFAKSSNYDPARDGFEHMTALDDCTSETHTSRLRVERATEASRALLLALADPTGGRAGRVARVEALLDTMFEREAGCTIDNDYCEAPELEEGAAGCDVASGGRSSTPWVVVVLVVVGAVIRRRRRTHGHIILAIASLGVGVAASHADLDDSRREPLSVYASVSASADHASLAGTAAIRYNAASWLSLGVDAEYNPWLSIDAGRIAPGLVNIYGTVIFKHKNIGGWQLRSSVNLGTSILLFDLVGVDKGSRGLYLGASPLSVAVPVNERCRLVIDPASVSIPAPLVKGFPFFYRQYRATVGVEIDL